MFPELLVTFCLIFTLNNPHSMASAIPLDLASSLEMYALKTVLPRLVIFDVINGPFLLVQQFAKNENIKSCTNTFLNLMKTHNAIFKPSCVHGEQVKGLEELYKRTSSLPYLVPFKCTNIFSMSKGTLVECLQISIGNYQTLFQDLMKVLNDISSVCGDDLVHFLDQTLSYVSNGCK